MVGADTDMTYPTTHLGDSAETLIDLANGYHPFSQVRRNCTMHHFVCITVYYTAINNYYCNGTIQECIILNLKALKFTTLLLYVCREYIELNALHIDIVDNHRHHGGFDY